MVSSRLGEINLVVQPWAGRQGAGANAGARIRACDQIAATGVVRILDKAPQRPGALSRILTTPVAAIWSQALIRAPALAPAPCLPAQGWTTRFISPRLELTISGC